MAPEIPSVHGHIGTATTPPDEREAGDTAAVLVAEGAETGSPWLEMSVMWFAPGRSAERTSDDRDTVLFVVEGEGRLVAGGREHALEPQTGALVPAGTTWAVDHAGPEELRMVAVAARPGERAGATQVVTVRLAEQEARAATGDRAFRVVIDPEVGCEAVTQFVGFIPPGRAPDHFHQYDEVIYVLEGRGRLHMEGRTTPFGAGATIHLPPRIVHCLENVGDDQMAVLGIFTPAGSPADAFYPDGTRAYYDPQ